MAGKSPEIRPNCEDFTVPTWYAGYDQLQQCTQCLCQASRVAVVGEDTDPVVGEVKAAKPWKEKVQDRFCWGIRQSQEFIQVILAS